MKKNLFASTVRIIGVFTLSVGLCSITVAQQTGGGGVTGDNTGGATTGTGTNTGTNGTGDAFAGGLDRTEAFSASNEVTRWARRPVSV